MSTAITFDLSELETFAKRLDELGSTQPVVEGIVGGLADLWVDESRRHVGFLTGQLYNRTNVVSVSATSSFGSATVESDTPYAGFHNYGTRRNRPNKYWTKAFWAVSGESRSLGVKVHQTSKRILESGGVWRSERQWVDPRSF